MWTRRRFIEAACSTGVASAALRSNEAGATVPAPPAERAKKGNSKPVSETPVQAAQAVLRRQLGERANEFDLKLIPLEGGNEVYEIEVTGGRVSLAGSSAVAMCRGAYSYLRATCNVMITWSGRHVELPAA